MRNVLRLRAAVKAVDAESKSRSAPSVEETLLDAEPVVTTVAQVAAPHPHRHRQPKRPLRPAVVPAKAKKE